MLELGLSQVRRLPYEAPVKRERQSSLPKVGLAFESLLATLAMGSDAAVSQAAAAALVGSGRIALLGEKFNQAPPESRRRIVTALLHDKTLRTTEALPVFLASRLTDQEDAQTVSYAVAGLADLQQRGVDRKLRWRFNLGMKQGADYKQLVKISAGTDDSSSASATTLLKALAMMSSSDVTEFESSKEQTARESKMTSLEQARQSSPKGAYMAMVYLDLKPADAPPVPGQTPPGATPQPLALPRTNMPIPAGEADLQAGGNMVHVVIDGSDLSISPPPGQSSAGQPIAMKLNASLLLRPVLSSPETMKEITPEQIDLSSLNETRECEMKYEQLGTWSGEASIPEPNTPADGKIYRIVGAKIVLEPLPAR